MERVKITQEQSAAFKQLRTEMKDFSILERHRSDVFWIGPYESLNGLSTFAINRMFEGNFDIDLARSAPETTEILNEVKADKGILTEEELTLNEKILNNSVRAKAMYETDHSLIEDIIASHRAIQERNRNLVLENDEQTAEIVKLKDVVYKCGVGCNSLASVLVGWNLPDGWTDWEIEEASTILYREFQEDIAYERYEVWLCWKSYRDATEKLEAYGDE